MQQPGPSSWDSKFIFDLLLSSLYYYIFIHTFIICFLCSVVLWSMILIHLGPCFYSQHPTAPSLPVGKNPKVWPGRCESFLAPADFIRSCLTKLGASEEWWGFANQRGCQNCRGRAALHFTQWFVFWLRSEQSLLQWHWCLRSYHCRRACGCKSRRQCLSRHGSWD